MTFAEDMARQIQNLYNDQEQLVTSIRADLNRMDSKDALRTFRDVCDAMDGSLNVLEFAHAMDTRDATEIGRLILRSWDAAGGREAYEALRSPTYGLFSEDEYHDNRERLRSVK